MHTVRFTLVTSRHFGYESKQRVPWPQSRPLSSCMGLHFRVHAFQLCNWVNQAQLNNLLQLNNPGLFTVELNQTYSNLEFLFTPDLVYRCTAVWSVYLYAWTVIESTLSFHPRWLHLNIYMYNKYRQPAWHVRCRWTIKRSVIIILVYLTAWPHLI